MKAIPYIALVIAISGIVIGTAAISLAQFGNTVTKCYNASFAYNTTEGQCDCAINNCTSSTAQSNGNLNFTTEYYSIYQAQQGNSEIAEQLPTVAIIGIMVIIISIIAGVFVYLRYFA